MQAGRLEAGIPPAVMAGAATTATAATPGAVADGVVEAVGDRDGSGDWARSEHLTDSFL